MWIGSSFQGRERRPALLWHHTGRRRRAAAALLLALAVLVRPELASANEGEAAKGEAAKGEAAKADAGKDNAAKADAAKADAAKDNAAKADAAKDNAAKDNAAKDNAEAEPETEKETETKKVEILASAGYGDLHVGLLQLGIEGVYRVTPHLGFGAAVDVFAVDNGADPQYSEPGTLAHGGHFLGFVEGDLLKYWVTPYARLGLGLGSYDRIYGNLRESKIGFAAQVAGGVAVRGGPFVLRGWLAPTLYGSDLVLVYGAGVGVRF